MFTQILATLDGSKLSEKAVPFALELAKSNNAIIHLLHVVSRQAEYEAPRGYGDAAVQAAEMSRDLARQLVEAQLSRGRQYLDSTAAEITNTGLKVETAILEGAADEKIVEYSRENGIDLIVMNTHGHSGFKRLIMGSVTDRVIRSVEVPVLVLRQS